MLGATRLGGSAAAVLVSTLAGGGATSGSVDGTGASARFYRPYDVVLTSDDTTAYIADRGNHNIRKIIVATGVVTTLAGSGSSGSADGAAGSCSFNAPLGLALTSDNAYLYVTDSSNFKIRRVSIATGVVSTLAGSGSSGSADGAAGSATFSSPVKAALSSDDAYLYVADFFNHKVRMVTVATGAVSTLAGSGSSGSADGAAGSAAFDRPDGLALTSDDAHLYVVDMWNHKIRVVTTATGAVSTLAGSGSSGSADGAAGVASFRRPHGIAISSDDSMLYVADHDSHKIRMVLTATGAVSTLAGDGSAGYDDGAAASASFYKPASLTLTSNDGVMYVAGEDAYGSLQMYSAVSHPWSCCNQGHFQMSHGGTAGGAPRPVARPLPRAPSRGAVVVLMISCPHAVSLAPSSRSKL